MGDKRYLLNLQPYLTCPLFQVYNMRILQKCIMYAQFFIFNSLKWEKNRGQMKLKLRQNFNCVFLSFHIRGYSEFTLCKCLNVKELCAWDRRDIWILSDCNGTWTHKHLVLERTLNHLEKLANLVKSLSDRLRTKWINKIVHCSIKTALSIIRPANFLKHSQHIRIQQSLYNRNYWCFFRIPFPWIFAFSYC